MQNIFNNCTIHTINNVDGTAIQIEASQEVYEAINHVKVGIEQEQDSVRKTGLSKWFGDLAGGMSKTAGEEVGKKAVEALGGLVASLPQYAAQFAIIHQFMGH